MTLFCSVTANNFTAKKAGFPCLSDHHTCLLSFFCDMRKHSTKAKESITDLAVFWEESNYWGTSCGVDNVLISLLICVLSKSIYFVSWGAT